MTADELIEQLAFGKTTPKVTHSLGMYLSPDTVYIAETHLEGGKLAVDHLVRIPVPIAEAAAKQGQSTPSATLNTDFLMDNLKLGALIRQSMAQIRWNSKDVVVTLSHHLALLRYFAMPAVERRFWKSAVPLEAKKYIPIPLEALSHDFQVIPLPPDAANKPRQGALIAVTQKKNLANVSALLENLGLNLVGMEVAPCSVLRVWETLNKEVAGKTQCQVHFDGGNIRILIADKGMPVFFRELFLGAEPTLGDQRKVDLGGCVTFAQKQLAVGQLSQLRISGTAPTLSSWQEAFSQEAGLPAVVQDTAALLGIKGGDWGGYASIGASSRFLAPTPVTLDLGRVGKISDEERSTARDLLALTGLMALYFIGLGLWRETLYRFKARELTRYKSDRSVEEVFKGKSNLDIEEMLKSMQAQVSLVTGLGGDSVKMTTLLKDVVDSLPSDKVWLSRIAISNPMTRSSGEQMDLQLLGHAVGQSVSQEQDLAFQFRDRLVKSPTIGRLFPDIQVSISGSHMGPEQLQGLDPDALAQRLEQRTAFTVSARARR